MKFNLKVLKFTIAIFLMLPLSPVHSEDKPLVVTTTGMITDAVIQIVGDTMEVRGLISSGVDPHLYKPTRSDIILMNTSDLVLYNGLLLEGRLIDAITRLSLSGKRVAAVTELIDHSLLLEPEEFKGHFDPHVWMDPNIWKYAVGVVLIELEKMSPSNSELYRSRTKDYLQKFDELHHYAEMLFKKVPESAKVLVTAHDAFNYFGKRYGLEVLGIQGLSTESEAGVRDIQRIVDTLVQRNIKAVFVESTVSKKNIAALVEGAKASGHVVKIGGELYSDAMGRQGTYEGTYPGMIDHNVTTIVRGLGGEAPKRGLYGKLSLIKESK